MNISQVIRKPVLTEKTVRGETMGKYTFEVDPDATKVDIKIALHQLYGVNVEKVNIIKGLPKFRIGKTRQAMQKRDTTRKAVITLKTGEKLDITKLKQVK